MKRFYVDKSNRIYYDESDLKDSLNIYLNIIDENGNYLTDDKGGELKDLSLSFDSTAKKYYCDITFNEKSKSQFIRLYFHSKDTEIPAKYQPQDAELITVTENYGQDIVPVQYFTDWVLAYDYKGDRLFKENVGGFIDENRSAIKRYLRSAIDDLEKKTELYFYERTVTSEMRDYFFDRFNIHLWQFIVNHPPINDLLKFEIQYASTPIAEISTKLFVWERETGIIEFLPAPAGDSAGLYTLLMDNLSGLTLTIFTHSNLERIPAMFRATYKTGLFYEGIDETEKEGLRQVISIRTLRKILNTLDPTSKTPSRTEGIDGVSTTYSYNNDRLGQQLKEQEDEYCYYLRRRYGKDIDMVVV